MMSDDDLRAAVRSVLDAEQAWSGSPDEVGPLTHAIQRLRDAYLARATEVRP